ncbi:MAG: diguanylate cyclase, partial [Alphaproteobacteria bacterium]|nr:diguanylate cyclase [Alphaproteobacteria bacterium]
VEYINTVVADILGMGADEVKGRNFLDFVNHEDWNLLAENIGLMLTESKSVSIRLQNKNGGMVETVLDALYIPDDEHFAFVLIGQHMKKENVVSPREYSNVEFYDSLTGLPNFYLFEDRVKVAVNREIYKDISAPKNMVAVAAISIDNIFALRQIGMEEFILKNLASKLALSLNKSYTIARGIKIQFWVLMSDLSDVNVLDVELKKIKAIFDDGVDDNLAHHEINSSIGVSVFPIVARSGKKLLDQTIAAVKKAQMENNGICFYNEDRSDSSAK